MHILLTNDDGLKALGLQTLKRELSAHNCRLTVVAPNGQRSAASHSMSINKALYCQELPREKEGIREIAVSGTPVDCVKMALEYFLKDDQPDLIISGINDGYNLGSDVLYSGTVSAAWKGLTTACRLCRIDERYDRRTLRGNGSLGMAVDSKNHPSGPFSRHRQRQRAAPRGNQLKKRSDYVPDRSDYHNVIAEKRDLDGSICYRIVGDIDMETAPPDSDVASVRDGHIALTPLKWQQTAERSLDHLKGALHL